MSTLGNDTPKQQMLAVLQQLPEDSSYDELLRELAFLRMIDHGIKDVEEGRIHTNGEVRRM